MTDLFYEASETTPTIQLDRVQGQLAITGESYPENALAFYSPLVTAVEEHLNQPEAALAIHFDLAYLNTSSVKALMDLLDMAEEAYQAGKAVSVEWRYDQENDRSLEMAEELQEDLSLPFELTPVAR